MTWSLTAHVLLVYMYDCKVTWVFSKPKLRFIIVQKTLNALWLNYGLMTIRFPKPMIWLICDFFCFGFLKCSETPSMLESSGWHVYSGDESRSRPTKFLLKSLLTSEGYFFSAFSLDVYFNCQRTVAKWYLTLHGSIGNFIPKYSLLRTSFARL